MDRGFLLIAIVNILILTGCSGHLSRSKAQSDMEREYQRCRDSVCVLGFGGHELLLPIGKVSGRCHGLAGYDPVAADPKHEYKALAHAGYITIKPERPHVWSVSLTDIGQHAIKGAPYGHTQKGDCDSWQVSLPLTRSIL